MQMNIVTTLEEEGRLYSKKHFICRATSREVADRPSSSPSFSLLSPYIIFQRGNYSFQDVHTLYLYIYFLISQSESEPSCLQTNELKGLIYSVEWQRGYLQVARRLVLVSKAVATMSGAPVVVHFRSIHGLRLQMLPNDDYKDDGGEKVASNVSF